MCPEFHISSRIISYEAVVFLPLLPLPVHLYWEIEVRGQSFCELALLLFAPELKSDSVFTDPRSDSIALQVDFEEADPPDWKTGLPHSFP